MAGLAIPDASRIRSVTEEILKRGEFHKTTPSAAETPDWLQRFFDFLGSKVFGNVTVGRLIFWIIVAAAAAVLIAVVLRLLIGEPGRVQRDGERPAEGGRAPAPDAGDGDLLKDAEKALGEGDMRAAVLPLYKACLRRLARDGLLVAARGKTNLTYLRECPRSSPRYPLLEGLTVAYNEVVYAHHDFPLDRMQSLAEQTRGLCGSP